MTGTVGRSLELYFIEGKPDGMLTAEVFNWTGHVLMTPRTRIMAALGRPEAKFTGIYVLLGEKDGEPTAYIGEGEDISERIRSHEQRKDWWTQAVLVTTGANALNKAHVKYLESRLVEIARTVRRRELENGNTPPRPSLSEAARANMESFLDYLLMVFPAIRVDMFQEYARQRERTDGRDVPPPPPTGPTFELVNRRHGLTARATLVGDDFIVLKDSTARLRWEGRGDWDHSYATLHAELRRTGVLAEDGERSIFTADCVFRSPSAAAAVVNGRPSSGPTEWKIPGTGQTYRDWEAAQLGVGTPEPT